MRHSFPGAVLLLIFVSVSMLHTQHWHLDEDAPASSCSICLSSAYKDVAMESDVLPHASPVKPQPVTFASMAVVSKEIPARLSRAPPAIS